MWDIHRKIRHYREKAGLSYEQLAAAPGVKCKWQSVQQWETRPAGKKTPTAPRRSRLKAVADALGTTEAELMSKAPPRDAPPAEEEGRDLTVRDGQEGMLLHLFRGLFGEQKRELIIELMVMFDWNNYTREQLGVKVLKGVSNEEVRANFGDVADLVKAKMAEQRAAQRARPPRTLDPHGGDPDVE